MGERSDKGPVFRASASRVEAYNEGLVVYLYDEACLQKIRKERGAELVEERLGPKRAVKGRSSRKPARPARLVAYELRQDNSVLLEVSVGPPLSREEKRRAPGLDWLPPERAAIHLPSGRLCVETANSSRLGLIPGQPPTEPTCRVQIPPGQYLLTLQRAELKRPAQGEETRPQEPLEVITLSALESPAEPVDAVEVLRYPTPEPGGNPTITGEGQFTCQAQMDLPGGFFMLNLGKEICERLGLERGVCMELLIQKQRLLLIHMGEMSGVSHEWLAATHDALGPESTAVLPASQQEVAVAVLRRAPADGRAVLWGFRPRVSHEFPTGSRWLKVKGRVLPHRLLSTESEALDGWTLEQGSLEGRVLGGTSRELVLGFPPEALSALGAGERSILALTVGDTTHRVIYLPRERALGSLLDEVFPLIGEAMDLQVVLSGQYCREPGRREEIREQVVRLFKRDPGLVAWPVPHWLDPSKKVLGVHPLAKDLTSFGVPYELGISVAPGSTVTVRLEVGAR